MKTHIVTDSGCDLALERIHHCGFTKVPLHLHFSDRVYTDDASLNIHDYLAHMEASPLCVKSASPSPKAFMDSYHAGEEVFAVTLSSKLSATYQSAMTAKRMYFEEYGRKFIYVFDSLSASVGEGLVALKIAECVKERLENLEIIERVNQFIRNMKTLFIIDKYDTLVKTGRISPYVAKVASMLNIKPICGADEGEIKMFEKARGYQKAMRRLTEIIKEHISQHATRTVSISHTVCPDRAHALKDEIMQSIPWVNVFIEEASGLIASYAGRGGLVVAV
jgi:DegV family protein with EDD domain